MRKRLGDLLVESGKISKEQLKDILNKQRGSGKKIGELLIEEKVITENEIIDVLEMQLGINRVHIDMIDVDMKAVKSIPESLARKYTVLPIGYFGNKIKITMADPLNIFAIDDLRITSGNEVIPTIATKNEILRGIDRYYSNRKVQKVAEELQNEVQIKKNDIKREKTLADEVKNAPVVKLIDTILSNAVKSRASDVHIEAFEEYIKIRYRVDGALQEVLKTSKETHSALVARIKIMANLNIAEKRIPQDGRIITKVDNNDVDLRVSILPTVHGEKIVIRILNKHSGLVKVDKLGFSEAEMDKLNRIVKSPYGIILVTGPTGSGKTTTLYSILGEVNKPDINIITIEDPVEFMVEGINQVNVNNKAGMTFSSGLRSILRQDPDIVMIGEIRDGETAQIAVRAAITGHLVLSTIHTNDSASAVVRLADMGVEPYLIATSFSGVVAQRLVRRICPFCKKEYIANNSEKRILGVLEEEELVLYKGEGCGKCNNKGYVGRMGIFELMEITREHRDLIQNNASVEDVRDLNRRLKVSTLKDSCSKLVLKGETTIEELAKIAFLDE